MRCENCICPVVEHYHHSSFRSLKVNPFSVAEVNQLPRPCISDPVDPVSLVGLDFRGRIIRTEDLSRHHLRIAPEHSLKSQKRALVETVLFEVLHYCFRRRLHRLPMARIV